jgi:hypothetical protein
LSGVDPRGVAGTTGYAPGSEGGQDDPLSPVIPARGMDGLL